MIGGMGTVVSSERVAVVTGGAHGLGKELARTLAGRGWRVVVVDIDVVGATAAANEIGERARVHVCDVSSAAAIDGLLAEVEATLGRLDLLINNAGVSLAARLDEMAADDLQWIVGVNLLGTMSMTRAALPLLLRTAQRSDAGARIVNILSVFGLTGSSGKCAYAATKFGLRGFGESLRSELRGSGVALTEVFPPAIATEIVRRGRFGNAARRDAEDRFLRENGWSATEVAERICRGIERGRDRVYVGMGVRAAAILARVAPGLARAAAERVSRRGGFA